MTPEAGATRSTPGSVPTCVNAGAGNDKINAATAGPPARIRAGKGWDTVRINRNERRRVRSAERIYVIR